MRTIFSRRNTLFAALILGAASTALTTAVTTTAIATGATVTIPTASAASPAPSARMAELVAAYKSALETVDTLAPDAATDPAVWSVAETAFMDAQAALMAERPATAADFAIKFDALAEIEGAEGEFAIMKQLSEDAHALAGAK